MPKPSTARVGTLPGNFHTGRLSFNGDCVNFYQHHIGDYRRDTAHLTLLEHGIYRQLLDSYYLSELPIPLETDLVFRRLSARTEEERVAIVLVLKEFFQQSDEGWIQTRCDKEIGVYQGRADRARTNGKLGGRPKKTKVVISRNRKGTETKANHEPITNNHEPYTPIAPKGVEGRFEEFWKAYPKKVGKDAAQKAFEKRKPDAEVLGAMLGALSVQKNSDRWLKDSGQYIPNPATWLNEGRWKDEIDGGYKNPFAGAI